MNQPAECDLIGYVEALQQQNRRLDRVCKLQLETIAVLQEHNQQLASALDTATQLLLAQNPNNPIAIQLRRAL